MANPNLSHLVFLLDRSGSMQSIKTDVIGGFHAFLAEQREADGHCAVTLAQFDHDYEVVYRGVPLAKVPQLELSPRGRTALLDSMGKLITDTAAQIDALPEEDKPGTVVVAIMTDGHENASVESRRAAIKALVEQQTNDHDRRPRERERGMAPGGYQSPCGATNQRSWVGVPLHGGRPGCRGGR
ncbi:vWA domain-containing protein [Mycolicibacterium conceptionense]|uniref:vWA domain-containing protein n=1 Tax=Mycolicibacterium conceptionense TaxID=451644 RepID=UPI001F394463|nr:vWA domain-containing protein [Mycolicibacterium conceptionense]